MTLSHLVLVGILVLVAANIAWNSWRSGRAFCPPLPQPYRNRESLENVWQQRFSDEKTRQEADAVLTMLCDAFSFNSDDRYRFVPDNHLHDIYRGCYPRWKLWKLGDNIELESFSLVLRKEFGVDLSERYPEGTLDEIVEMVINNRPTKG